MKGAGGGIRKREDVSLARDEVLFWGGAELVDELMDDESVEGCWVCRMSPYPISPRSWWKIWKCVSNQPYWDSILMAAISTRDKAR